MRRDLSDGEVRAVVDDAVYLTDGLGPNARNISFDGRNGYEAAGRGSYYTAVTEEIYASRKG